MAADDLFRFLFDVSAWRGSRSVQRMSFAERGVYFEMLLEQWERRSLPDDAQQVAEAIASSDAQIAEVLSAWEVVRRKFDERAGRLQNDALERTRRKQREYRRARQEAGALGGRARAANRSNVKYLSPSNAKHVLSTAVAKPSDKVSKVKAREGEEREGKGSEVEPVSAVVAAAPPALLTFPTTGPIRSWDLTQADLDKLQAAYDTLDVLAECRRALLWAQTNPSKRKTARGMPAFLSAWMGRAANGSRRASVPASADGLLSDTARYNLAAAEEAKRIIMANDAARQATGGDREH